MASTSNENLSLEIRHFFDIQIPVEPIISSGAAKTDSIKIENLLANTVVTDRNLIETFLANLRYVTDNELMTKLEASIKQLPVGPFDLLLITHDNKFKSNHWLIHRLWPLLKDKIANIITSYDMVPQNPLLYIDDVMMTGNQFINILYEYADHLQNILLIPQIIYTIIPFISTIALKIITKIVFYGIYYTVYLVPPPILEIIPVIDVSSSPEYAQFNNFAIPIYFDHKIAEAFCTSCNIIKAIVSIEPSRASIEEENLLFLKYLDREVSTTDDLGRVVCMFEPIQDVKGENYYPLNECNCLVVTDRKKREMLTQSLIILRNAEANIIYDLETTDEWTEDEDGHLRIIEKVLVSETQKSIAYHIVKLGKTPVYPHMLQLIKLYPEDFSFRVTTGLKNSLEDVLGLDSYFLNFNESNDWHREKIIRAGVIPYYIMAYEPYDNLFLGGVWTFTRTGYPYIGMYGIRSTVLRFLTKSRDPRMRGIAELLISHILKFARLNNLIKLVVIDPLEGMIPILRKLNFIASSRATFNETIQNFYDPVSPMKVYWYLDII